MNKSFHPDNTSGIKGVDWRPRRRAWRARIFVNGKSLHLGLFETSELARIAYEEAARKYFGPFAGKTSSDRHFLTLELNAFSSVK
jgi:hypothetical protein